MSKREAILGATLKQLASKGFHGFSIKQVALEAGVATGTVYLYFTDRDDLILQLHTAIIETVASYLFAEHDDTQPFFTQYRQFCLSLWRMFKEQPDILISKAQFDHLPPATLTEKYEAARAVLYPFMHFLELGREQQVMRDMPDEVLFCMGFECYFALARKQMLGLVEINEECLEKVIAANWGAIAMPK